MPEKPDYSGLKVDVAQARSLADEGRSVEALEILERVFGYIDYWHFHFGKDPELESIMAAIRKLSGQIRGRMTDVALRGPGMGLHTKEERQYAYSIAQRAYQRALKDISRGGSPVASINYALGSLDAIAELVKAEGADEELLSLLSKMYDGLSQKLYEFSERS